MKKLFLFAAFSLPLFLFAQQKFTAIPVAKSTAASLSKTFKNYSLFAFDANAVNGYVKDRQPGEVGFELVLPGYAELHFTIHPNDILAADYTMVVADGAGRKIFPKPACMTFNGSLKNEAGSNVNLTLTPNLFYGMIHGSSKEYFIEPLRYFDPAGADNIFVIYETKDVNPLPGVTCGVTERAERLNGNNFIAGPSGIGVCKLTELAIATDVGMVNRYGSAAAAAEHNIAVVNTMVNIYSDELFGANYLEFKIIVQYMPSLPALDPVGGNASTDASTLLSAFQAWGQAGNFGAVTYDLAVFWTTRDLTFGGSNGVIGLAYVGVVCSAFRYQILEDLNGATGLQEGALQSHETGHNFNANHDAVGDPFIMAPSLGNPPATTFSPTSISVITAHINSVACLSACIAQLPTAEFNRSSNGICTGNSVTVTDASTGDVSSRTWSFPGGSPSSSTLATQAVTYSTPGIKIITLSVTNATGTTNISKEVFVSPAFTTANCRTTTAPGNAETPLLVAFSLGTVDHTESLFLGGSYTNFSCTENTALLPATTYTGTINLGFTSPDIFCIGEVFIDYNNDGDFSDIGELITRSGCIRNRYEFNFTTPVPIVTNQFLRMRVMVIACANVSTNGCSMPSNAQARDFGVYFAAAVVPVNLLSFEGQHINGKNLLQWRTASEMNSHHFDIERSIDGISFSAIGQVMSAGNPGIQHQYHFTDGLNDVKGYDRFYYRLNMVDNDGQHKYSHVIQLNRMNNSPVVVYPNPVKRGGLLQLYILNNKGTAINIFNALGQLVHSRPAVSGNDVSIPIPASWSAGLYIIRFSDGEKNISKTFRVE